MNTEPTNQRPAAIETIRDAIRNSAPVQPGPSNKSEVMIIPLPPQASRKKRAPQATKKTPEKKVVEKTAADNPPYQPTPGSLAPGDKMMDIKTANQWMDEQRLKPAPRKLFGNFWLEGELCLLFADTNMGKSILAVQIGDSISRRQPIAPFEQDAMGLPVLYFDFELSAKQFELRYRDGAAVHRFSDWFYRAEYNPQEVPARYATFDEYMHDSLNWAIRNTEPKTLIIDNITCLTEGNHQTATRAITLMKYLKSLQAKTKLNILVLAHTPKRPAGKIIGRDDMGGSKMLMNFADSAFAIGQSNMPDGLRYLKQIKQRSGGQQYGEDNICLVDLVRTNGFLGYVFKGYGNERDQVRRHAQPLTTDIAVQVAALHAQGASQRQIASRTGIGLGSVHRILGKVRQANEHSEVKLPEVAMEIIEQREEGVIDGGEE